MNMKNRLAKLEKDTAPAPRQTMSDEERLERIKELSLSIADRARAAGITAKDDPGLALPLAIAEVIRERP